MSSYREEIIRLTNSKTYQMLSVYYGRRSLFDILGVARRELTHSRFLAWLLDPTANHGCGAYPLMKFLQAIVMAKTKFSELNKDSSLSDVPVDVLVTGGYEIRGVTVRTEVPVSGRKRIDLLLEASLACGGIVRQLPIIVENKVKSDEHDRQTEAYYMWAEAKFGDRRAYWCPIYIFLTPDKTLNMVNGSGRGCACAAYVRMNYQLLVDYVIEPMRNQITTDQAKTLVGDYLRCLSYADITKEERKVEGVMARSKEESQLLRQFWENNSSLFTAVFEALSEDDNYSDADRKMFGKVAKTSERKDYTRYRLAGDEEIYSKRGIVGAVIAAYLVRERARGRVTLAKFKRDFPKNLHSGGFFRLWADVTDKSRFFTPVTLDDGVEIACSNQWGSPNIGGFLKRAKELGFCIESVNEGARS